MHNPRVSLLFALSYTFPADQMEKLHCRFNLRDVPRRTDEKIKPALYSVYVLHSTSR